MTIEKVLVLSDSYYGFYNSTKHYVICATAIKRFFGESPNKIKLKLSDRELKNSIGLSFENRCWGMQKRKIKFETTEALWEFLEEKFKVTSYGRKDLWLKLVK